MNGKTKLSRLAYKEFQLSLKPEHRKARERQEQKWINDINFFQQGSTTHIYTASKNTYLQSFHYRLICRIIPTKKFLYAIGRAENNLCTFCNSSVETLVHLFWDCACVKKFITDIKRNIFDKFNIMYNVTKKSWFFPSLEDSTQMEILITTIGKLTIFKAQNKNQRLSIHYFLNTLKLEVQTEQISARINDRLELFDKKWGRLKSITKIDIQGLTRNTQHAHRPR